jgi:hypothetical protein
MKSRTAGWLFFMVLLSANVWAQSIGEVDTAGTTWYDVQHVGSCGRMVAVDSAGFAHVAWMNQVNMEDRHISYNLWDPETQAFTYPSGVQVDNSDRAGYVTLACTVEGNAVPVFHAVYLNPTNARISLCCDSPPHSGWFGCGSAQDSGYWAQAGLDVVGRMHVLYNDIPGGGDVRAALRYVRVEDFCGEFPNPQWSEALLFDSTETVAHVTACSRHSERISAGWAHPRSGHNDFDNDAYVRISENGGDTWQPVMNVTEFQAGDSACCDTAVFPMVCVGDTFRLYTDLSLLFDEDDALHTAFTARTFYDLGVCGGESYSWSGHSGIWHWSEATQNFSLIAGAFYFLTINNGTIITDGVWQTNVQRPSLAIDTTTGFLYCAYMQYDSNQYSDAGYPMADVFVSVSTDNGEHWSVGTNVTRSDGGQNTPAPGSLSERDISLAEVVTDGYLHLFYELDRDAGSSWISPSEGTETLNPMLCQRVPVDSIQTSPLVPNYPLHRDSTGFVKASERPEPVPQQVNLQPAYPNPFNSTTTITFDLPVRSRVRLAVYDVLGRRAALLTSGMMEAGHHTQTWRADALASGIYFVVLEAAHVQKVQKVMLLR